MDVETILSEIHASGDFPAKYLKDWITVAKNNRLTIDLVIEMGESIINSLNLPPRLYWECKRRQEERRAYLKKKESLSPKKRAR